MENRIDAAWTALHACLSARARDLDAEVRTYPTPIARCDEQLTKAIADRDAAYRRLNAVEALDAQRAQLPQRAWLGQVARFAAQRAPDEDAAVAAAQERLAAALGL